MKKKKLLSAVAIISLSSMLAVGCSGGGGKTAVETTSPAPVVSASTKPPEQAPDKPTGEFRFFINGGAVWDPAIWDWGSHHDQIGIFEGLVHYSQGKVVPGVATDWKEEGNKWTFHLRKDSKFSNGDPVDANTFVYSIQRAVNPKTIEGTGKSSSFFGDAAIKNWLQVKSGAMKVEELGVKAIDPYTLEITLEAPDKALIDKLALDPWQLPVDQKVVDGQPMSIWQDGSKIVSNGPYMIDSLNVKTDMVLKPNPNYYGKVSLAKIHLTWGSAQIKQFLVYKNNEADMASLDSEDVPAVKGDTALSKELNWFETAISYTMQVRHSTNPALQDQRVRQAFAMAIDKQAIADKVLLGTGVPSYDPTITPWMADWIKGSGVQFDLAKAKDLMKQAGYPDGKGFPTVTILVPGTTDKVAQAIQQMWEQNLGVTVKYQGEEYGNYITKFDQLTDEGTVGFVQNGVGPTLPDWKENIVPQDETRNDWPKIAMDPKAWKTYYDTIKTDTKLDNATRTQKTIDFFKQNFPKDVMDQLNKGIDAYKKGDDAGMKDYIKWRDQSALMIPVYQVRNAIMLKPNVHGYFPLRMWLSTPPDWMNDITVK
jgi:oligopeptide transport system substrate-binding protein